MTLWMGGQRCRDDHEIRLGRAGDELDQGVLAGNQLLDDRLGAAAPDVLAVAREALGVGGGQGAQDGTAPRGYNRC